MHACSMQPRGCCVAEQAVRVPCGVFAQLLGAAGTPPAPGHQAPPASGRSEAEPRQWEVIVRDQRRSQRDQFDVEDDQRDHLGGPAAEPAPRHEAPDAAEALRQVVNKEFVQRRGDMVVRPDDKHDGSRWNAWTAEATLRTAFGTSSPVGRSRQSGQAKGGGRATHVGQAGHGGQVLDTKVVVTTAALEAQSAAWERTLGTMMGQGRRRPWMVIERAWDETVMTLSFSKEVAASQLAWSLNRLARKLNLDAAQMSKLSEILSVANSGPCQVMVQRLVARWSSHPESVAEFFVPPVALSSNSAAAISAALEQSFPMFSLEKIRQMAMSGVHWVGLIYVKDGLAANGKLTAMHQASLPVNVFLMEVTCLIHAMYMPLKLLGRCSAPDACWACRTPSGA